MSATRGNGLLSSLPLELRLEILSLLPDPRSLASAALTCRSLYAAFKRNKDDLVRASLIRCIGVDLLPEATIVQRCNPPERSRLFRQVRYPASVSDSIDTYTLQFVSQLERPVVSFTTWNLGEAAQMVEFYTSTVSSLVRMFIHFCLQSPYSKLQDTFTVRPITRQEENRIARALYRFELFTKLYACFQHRPVSLFNCSPGFFLKFAPWEHTQLGCIHDFLGRQLAPVFNQVARTDYDWTARHKVPVNTNLHNPYIQHLLSMGLEWIHKLITKSSIEEFRSVLRVDFQAPRWNDFFLEYVLRDLLDENYNPDQTQLDEFEHSNEFFQDMDPGSVWIWRVSRTESSLAVYSARNWQHRHWGYALWDHERLDELDALSWPWQPAPEAEQFPEEMSLEDVKKSWESKTEPANPAGHW